MKKNLIGSTLLEIIISIMIVSIVLVGVSYQFSVGMDATSKNRVKLQMSLYAKDLMEEVLSKNHWKTNATCSALTFDSGETRFGGSGVSPFNDVDDYNNYSEQSPLRDANGVIIPNTSAFKRTVSIVWVDPNSATLAVSPAFKNLKRITIKVDYSPSSSPGSPFTQLKATYSIVQIISRP